MKQSERYQVAAFVILVLLAVFNYVIVASSADKMTHKLSEIQESVDNMFTSVGG